MGGIVGLGGGTGASRLWRALAGPAGEGQLTLVVSTADSLWQHGLRICPGLDTVLYALSGRLDPGRGWGIRDDSFRCMGGVAFEGIGQAVPAPGVLAAIESAGLIVLGPSDPVAGLLPILGLPGVTEALRNRRDRVTAVSPIAAGAAISGPGQRRRSQSRAALLAAVNLPATAAGVARLYRDVCSRFVYDPGDRDEAPRIAAHGVEPVPAPLLRQAGTPPGPLISALLRPAGVSGG